MALVTKKQELAKYLRDRIRSGHWSPGERLPGEFDLQAQFGFSRATVRDALNTLEGEGIVVRINGNGTFVSENREVECVGIVADARHLSSPGGYWFQSLVEVAQRLITDAGFQAVLMVGNGKSSEEFVASTNMLNTIRTSNLVGVINTTCIPLVTELLTSEGVNNVAIESTAPIGNYCIMLDYALYVETAVRMLESRGYADFAVMHGSLGNRFADERDELVQQEQSRLLTIAVNGNPDRLIPVSDWDERRSAYECFIKWWNSPNRTGSIFIYDDTYVDMASKAIIELGINVPKDLAILTHANVGRQFHFPIEFTRIGFDATTVVGAALEMLERLIRGERVFRSVVTMQPVVQPGESLGEGIDGNDRGETSRIGSGLGAWSRSELCSSRA